jgi:hypothetical protein
VEGEEVDEADADEADVGGNPIKKSNGLKGVDEDEGVEVEAEEEGAFIPIIENRFAKLNGGLLGVLVDDGADVVVVDADEEDEAEDEDDVEDDEDGGCCGCPNIL